MAMLEARLGSFRSCVKTWKLYSCATMPTTEVGSSRFLRPTSVHLETGVLLMIFNRSTMELHKTKAPSEPSLFLCYLFDLSFVSNAFTCEIPNVIFSVRQSAKQSHIRTNLSGRDLLVKILEIIDTIITKYKGKSFTLRAFVFRICVRT
jgi:hypothetical protein